MPAARDASIILYSLLVGLILATMGFAFVGSQANLWRQSLALLGLFLAVWFMGSMISFVEAQGEIDLTAHTIRRAPLLISASWGFILIITHIFVAQVDATRVFVSYYLCLLLTLLTGAAVLLRSMPTPLRFWQRTHWWLYPLLIAGTATLIVSVNLRPIRADIYYQQGLAYANGGHWDESIALFQQALRLAPGTDFYYPFLAGAYVEKAKAAWDVSERSAWLEEARKALERGREISPLNADHVMRLGLLHRAWGEMLTDPKQKDKQFNKALEHYRQAEGLRPHNAMLLKEWGLAHYAVGEYEEAIDRYRRSLSLDDSSFETYLLWGDAYRATKDLARAVEAYHQATRIAPSDFRGHKNLALVYQHMGRIEEAIAEAEIARSLAPANEVGSLEELVVYLEAEKP